MIWLGLSVVWFVAAFFLSIAVGVLAERLENLRYAAMAISWAMMGFGGFMALAWGAGVIRSVDKRAGALVIANLAAATLLAITYVAWAFANHGALDPDSLLRAVFIPILGMGVGLYAAAGVVTVRPTSLVALIVSGVVVGGLLLAGVGNIGRIADGLSAEGAWMIVAAMGLTATSLVCARTVLGARSG